MAVLPPFSTKPNISSPTTNRSINRNKHFVIVFCALLLFCLQLTSTAKTNDCASLGAGGCRGQGWDNGEWPILQKGAKSLSECCRDCSKKKGCTSFHLGKLTNHKGDCFLFSHTAITPVKSLGGECYQLTKGKGNDEDDDDEDGPTEEQCKKFVTKACKGQEKKSTTQPSHKTPGKPDKGKDKQADETPNKKSEKKKEAVVIKEKDEDDEDDDDSLKKYNELKAKQLADQKGKKKEEKPAAKEKPATKPSETPATKPSEKPEVKQKPAVKSPDAAKKKDDNQKETDKKKVEIKQEDKKPKSAQKVKTVEKPPTKPAIKETPIAASKPKEAIKKDEAPGNAKSSTPRENSAKEKKVSGKKEGAEKEKTKEKVKEPKPKAPEKQKSEKPKEQPKSTKKVDTGPKQYFGKFLKKVGIGGCRGKNWNTKNCPKFSGRKTLDGCAMECRQSEFCTAFHILKPEKDQTFDCLLFSHKDIIAVNGLGGVCYTFSDKPPQEDEDDEAGIDDIEEEKDEISGHTGPVIPLLLGDGFCRGPKWTFKNWPVPKGRLDKLDCAEACAKKKGCTAYDISMEHKGKFDCLLYGHKGVVPASGISKLPAKCYVLKGSPLSKLLDEEDIVTTEGSTLDELEEEDEEEGDEKDVGDAKYSLVGKGMCRGSKWQTENWPKSRGLKTINQCASACQKKVGCRSFDMSPPDSTKSQKAEKGKLWCNLYANKDVKAASGVPGNCYKVQKDLSELAGIPDDEEMVIDDDVILAEEVDDSLLNSIPKEGAGFKNLGKGLCRGPNWQDARKIWPKDDGKETFEECLTECKKDKGCTAFDVSPVPNSLKFQCMLFGHQDVRPANGISKLPGRCIKMTGRHSLSPKEEPVAEDGEGFVSLGKGLCRGQDWQTIHGKWPLDKGMKTIKECYTVCKNTGGCTAFDIRDPEKKKYHCFLFGHKHIVSATGLSGTCYKITGTIAPERLDEVYDKQPSKVGGLVKTGSGACRGPGWQDVNPKWPHEIGISTTLQCEEACSTTDGCTAYDLREADDDKKKLVCTLYGHKNVIPAVGVSHVPANCYPAPKEGFLATRHKTRTVAAKNIPKKPKEYKIPKFDDPKVIHDEDVVSDDDDEWLFEPPPSEIRSRAHINEILEQDAPSNSKMEQKHLKGLKKIYETSIQPLEDSYKYSSLSNRHFGDPEIFSKPLVVLMGPWSGGKSTMINYLLGTEYTQNAFRAAAEPSPGFNFNIAMYGEQEEELEGTELAAEFSFSSLQKFGQEFLKKLRGKKMANKLLQKATFAEIPGVLETGSKRKVDRLYPFNEACQWFIDHADLILVVYDYTKLDIGPETEALLDQLKGRESQVRIILNKADEITAEELLKIQGNLMWNVSPLMSSLEPPTLYAGSFWSHPYKEQAPKKLLKAQEMSLLKDIREAMDKRVINRIANARRFAVRVRNHAKMVDCYLNTYNNNKGTFGNKKVVDDIVQRPEKYHIYEGISSMTNISRFDLPDPDTYKVFFGLHPLPDFKTLQETCRYFKGCPIDRLDQAIAYELPDALTAYKREISGIPNTKQK